MLTALGKTKEGKLLQKVPLVMENRVMEVRLYFGKWPTSLLLLAVSLDTATNLKPELTREQLLDAIADHITAQVRLVDIYES